MSGNSLSGLLAELGRRSLTGSCLGLVIVGLQQTPLDGLASLRLFADLDTALLGLLAGLGCSLTGSAHQYRNNIKDQAEVPYDSAGRRTTGLVKTTLDLRPGAELLLAGTGSGTGRVLRYCPTQQVR